jgi:hypothetical protein
MKIWTLPVALAALVLSAPNTAEAQAPLRFHVGAGLLAPMGDLGDSHESGWVAHAGVMRQLGANPKLGAGIVVFYGHAEFKGNSGDATNIPGAAVELSYALGSGTGRITPYVAGGAGVLQHRYSPGNDAFDSESETSVLFGAGGGISIGTRLGLNVRYIVADGTDFVPVTLSIGFGG